MSVAIKDHDGFRDLLNKCEPKERIHMYEAVRSYLRFEVKPLDVYVAELGMLAEAKQLPLVTAEGTLKPFNVVDIRTRPAPVDYDDDEIAPFLKERAAREAEQAQSLIEAAAATKHLELICTRCTRAGDFHGWNKDAAVAQARKAGWRLALEVGPPKEICPKCQ
jgi:hypothetical protein